MLARAHQFAPVIRDWCTYCKAYTSQGNGFTANHTPATECLRCGGVLHWH